MILTNGKHQMEASVLGGTVTRWQHGDTHVLFPQQRLYVGENLKLRGGIPICVPIHGKMPSGGRWLRNFWLPQHGFARNTLMEYVGVEKSVQGQMNFVHVGTETYPWGFNCAVFLHVAEGVIYHTVILFRMKEKDLSGKWPGTPEGGMPVASGIHPYFATPDGEWCLNHGGRILHRRDLELGKSQTWELIPGRSVLLSTRLGVVVIQPKLPYEEIVIWTDSRKYVCVEPVTKRGVFGTLDGINMDEDREPLALDCNFTFEPYDEE